MNLHFIFSVTKIRPEEAQCEWIGIHQHGVIGNNNYFINRVQSTSDCLKLCEIEQRFKCMSVQYHPTYQYGHCSLHRDTRNTYGFPFQALGGYHYFEKYCAGIAPETTLLYKCM